MAENKKYRGTFWSAAIRVLVYGFLSGLALEFIILFASMIFQGNVIWVLYGILHWPKGFFWSMAVSAGILFFRHTTVEIRAEKINICRAWHRESFELAQFLDSSAARKTHIGSYSKFVTVKCYLIFETSDGIQSCRLYGFRERDLEKVLEAIHNAVTAHLTDEEKAAITEEYINEASEALIQGRKGNNEFSLPASSLIKKEKEYLKKSSLAAAGIIILVGIMDLYAILVNHAFSLKLLYLTMLALMLLALMLAAYINLSRKQSICAERIVTDGEHLTVGEDYYSYSCIKKIRMTSPRKKSGSIFPVQRYMYVSANGTTKKYWLGSEVSFRAYESLCRSLELSMVSNPSRLKYK